MLLLCEAMTNQHEQLLMHSLPI